MTYRLLLLILFCHAAYAETPPQYFPGCYANKAVYFVRFDNGNKALEICNVPKGYRITWGEATVVDRRQTERVSYSFTLPTARIIEALKSPFRSRSRHHKH